MALLEVKSLGISFGGLRAVDDFNLKIEKGQLYGLIGPNGAGKTTTVGKIASAMAARGKNVVIGSADTFRAAAAEQLETWGAMVYVPCVRSDREGADQASVAFEASAKAKEPGTDVRIIDTAGRLLN